MSPFPGRQDVGIETELRLGLFALIQAFNQMYNLGISADKSSKLSMTFGSLLRDASNCWEIVWLKRSQCFDLSYSKRQWKQLISGYVV